MSDFRDAVAQVRADAKAGNLSGLETVLYNPYAERAARSAAAHLLARAGSEGLERLRIATLAGNARTQAFAAKAYLRAQENLSADVLIKAAHHPHRPMRRAARRLLKHVGPADTGELRLRSHFPAPFYQDPHAAENLARYLKTPGVQGDQVAEAIALARYLTGIPLLIAELETRGTYHSYSLWWALRRLGAQAVPFLIAARADAASSRDAIDQLLIQLGQEQTVRGFVPPSRVLPETAHQKDALNFAEVVPKQYVGVRGIVSRWWERLMG